MRGPAAFLSCAILVIMAVSSIPGTVLAVPEHDDQIFAWKHERDEANPAQDDVEGCGHIQPVSQTDPIEVVDNGRCKILAYEVGNTNEHLFVRWTLETLEFDSQAEGTYVDYEQGFRGSAEELASFGFTLRVSSSDDVEVHTVNGIDGDIEADIVGPRSDGVLVAAIPFSAIQARFANFTASEPFVLSKNPTAQTEFTVSQLCNPTYTKPLFCGEDELAGAASTENWTVHLQPYLDFQAPPQTYFHDLSGLPQTIDYGFTNATTRTPWVSETNLYNITIDAAVFNMTADAQVDEGDVRVTFTGPDGQDQLDATELDGLAEEFAELGTGTWVLNVTVDRFVGKIAISLDEIVQENGGGGDGGGGGSNNQGGGGGTGGNGTDGSSVEDNGIPGPGAVFVVAALLAGLQSLRRLRGSRGRRD